MPAKPLVQSEATRAAVIAVIMLGVLGLALAAAYAFTLKQRRPAEVELAPHEVGGLEFRAPASWRWRGERGERGGPGLGSVAFFDPRSNHHVLMVEALRWPAPAPPGLVLAELLGPWLRQKGPWIWRTSRPSRSR